MAEHPIALPRIAPAASFEDAAKASPAPGTSPGWGPGFLVDMAAHVLLAVAAVGTMVFAVDVALLLRHGSPWPRALTTGALAASVFTLLVTVGSPISIVLERVRLRLSRTRLRPFASTATLVVGAWIAWSVATPVDNLRARWLVVSLFLVAASVAVGLVRRRDGIGWATLALAGASLAVDVLSSKAMYRELHDLLGLFTVVCVVAALQRLRPRIARRSRLELASLIGLAVGGSLGLIHVADRAAPGWRRDSMLWSRYESRLMRAARALWDFDGDGFSPILWGADCDDSDPMKSPIVWDRPGAPDRNCNGVRPPAQPTDADRGLTPPTGVPDLPPQAIDRVLLVTIDCLRADALRPEVMPNLASLAKQGLRLTRLYAASANTRTSTRLIQGAEHEAQPVSRSLADHGVATAAVIGLGNRRLFAGATAGFGRIVQPQGDFARWSADEVTARAIDELGRMPGRGYVWAHYYDAHAPYRAQTNPHRQSIYLSESPADYRAQLTRIDASLGRLVDTLRANGQLARTAILVTGDHGEALGEHEVPSHHVGAWEAVVRVPGVLFAPGVGPATYDRVTTHRDFPATILGAFGLVSHTPAVETWGRSLLRVRSGGDAPLHAFVAVRTGRAASGAQSLSPVLAIVGDRYKLTKSLEDDLIELYDVVADPDERWDLSTNAPGLTRKYVHDLALFRDLDQWPKWPQPLDLGPS